MHKQFLTRVTPLYVSLATVLKYSTVYCLLFFVTVRLKLDDLKKKEAGPKAQEDKMKTGGPTILSCDTCELFDVTINFKARC